MTMMKIEKRERPETTIISWVYQAPTHENKTPRQNADKTFK